MILSGRKLIVACGFLAVAFNAWAQVDEQKILGKYGERFDAQGFQALSGGDDEVTQEEWAMNQAKAEAIFGSFEWNNAIACCDVNQDGVLTREEVKRYRDRERRKMIVRYRKDQVEDEMVGELKKRYPGLTDEEAQKMHQFQRNHSSISLEEIKDVFSFYNNHPGIDYADAKDAWMFHKNHPGFDKEDFVDAWQFHKRHPDVGRDGFQKAWQFHKDFPAITKDHFKEAWSYYQSHPDIPKAEFRDAWRAYQEKGAVEAEAPVVEQAPVDQSESQE